MDFNEITLFGNKSYSELLKDIYDNSKKKSKQIDDFLTQLKALIKSSNDAAILIPMVKDYLEVSVKNDEQLVKMAGVVQRFFSSVNRNSVGDNYGGLLTAEEKQQLLKEVEAVAKESESIEKDVERIKIEKE